jgi:TrmH family RNA methyltransferase
VRQLRSRTERDRTGTFYIEGARIVAQAVQAGAEITQGVVAPDLIVGTHAANTVAALRATGAPIMEVSIPAFESISFKENLQGIGAVVRAQVGTLAAIPADETRLWVALDGVGNSGNLGAIMRTCDAVGGAGLILLGNTTDPHHPDAVRASMGSLFALQVVRAGFDEFVAWKAAHGYTVIGTSPAATQEYRAVSYPPAAILLMGSERTGLSPTQQAASDQLVQIPMVGTADSLNLGVATSIVLYEIFYQQRAAPPGQTTPAD